MTHKEARAVALNLPPDPGIALHEQLEETDRGLVYDLSTLLDRRLRAVRRWLGVADIRRDQHVVGCERLGCGGR